MGAMTSSFGRSLLGAVLAISLSACTGSIGGDSTTGGPEDLGDPNSPFGPDDPDNPKTAAGSLAREVAATSGLRRLSVDEYDNTVRDLLGIGSRLGATFLPKDVH